MVKLAKMETYLNFIAVQIDPIGAMIMKRIKERIAGCTEPPLISTSTLKRSRIFEKKSFGQLLSSSGMLQREVWQKGACSSCMACLSICPAGCLAFDCEENGLYQVASCMDCGACLDVCPRIPANNNKIYSSPILGPYSAIKNARLKKNSKRCQERGAVTALLTAALDEELVDCALVMDHDHWSQKAYPRAVYDARELESCAGGKYTSNAILEPLGDLAKSAKNIAIVGTACSVDAIGLMRMSSNEFAQKIARKIRFALGLFCFEAYNESLIKALTEISGVSTWRFDGMDNSEAKMTIGLRGDGSKTIPLHRLAEHIKTGCKACADFTAKLSDISVGNIGGAPGMNSVIIRTAEGAGLFNIAEEMGLLEVSDGVDLQAIEKAGRLKLTKNGTIRSSFFARSR